MKRTALLLMLLGWGGMSQTSAQPYQDAAVFGAKGNVKTLTITTQQPSKTIRTFYAFSPSGELTETQQGPIVSLEHDNQGRLSKYVYNESGSYQQYAYDEQGRVAKKYFPSGETTFTYDENGLVTQETEHFFSLTLIRYQYLAFDDRGNWTHRHCNRNGTEIDETRAITYWPESSSVSASSSVSQPRETIVLGNASPSDSHTRSIDEKYRSLLEYTLHGWQNDYLITLGQTSIVAMKQLDDVTYSDVRGQGDQISKLTLGDGAISFQTSIGPSPLVQSISYAPQSIPEAWETRYGIDLQLLQDPNRREKLEAQGLQFLSVSDQTTFSYRHETYYVGSDIFDQLFRLILTSDNGRLFSITIELEEDDEGNYPQLPATSAEDHPTSAAISASAPSSSGGFLKAFDKLAQQKARQEAAQKHARKSAQATVSADRPTSSPNASATNAASRTPNAGATSDPSDPNALSVLDLINHPFGVLSTQVTGSEAVQELNAHEGWMAELWDRTRIELSPQRGYRLTYNGRIPYAFAWFADSAPGKLSSYAYQFPFISGKDTPLEAPMAALRLRAIRFAYLLASELELQDIKLTEQPLNQIRNEELSLRYEDDQRLIRLYVTNTQSEAFQVVLNIQVK